MVLIHKTEYIKTYTAELEVKQGGDMNSESCTCILSAAVGLDEDA